MNFLLSLGLIVCSISLSAKLQQFEPSSWWHHMSSSDYARNANNEQHRKDRGQIFIDDTQRWLHNNEVIPEHRNADSQTVVRVMTFNVRYWTNCLSEPTHNTIFEIIQKTNPDILIMQEAEFEVSRYNSWSGPELIQKFRDLGYAYGGLESFGTIYTEQNGYIGTVIFSKFPLENLKVRRFTSTARWTENQSYVHAYVTVHGKQLSIYATHLIAESAPILFRNAAESRLAQVQQLQKMIAKDSCPNCFIAADCNAVRKQDLQDVIDGHLIWDLANRDYQDYVQRDHSTAALDFLADNNFKNSFEYLNLDCPKVTTWSGIAVDNIFLSPRWNLPLRGSYVYFTDASDHYPLIMDINLH